MPPLGVRTMFTGGTPSVGLLARIEVAMAVSAAMAQANATNVPFAKTVRVSLIPNPILFERDCGRRRHGKPVHKTEAADAQCALPGCSQSLNVIHFELEKRSLRNERLRIRPSHVLVVGLVEAVSLL